jgi:ATP-binding cassette subfamily B protein
MEELRKRFADTVRNFQPLKVYFVRNRWALLFGVSSLLVTDFLQLFIPLIIKRAIDLLTEGTASSRLLLLHAALITGIALLMVLFRYLWRLLLLGHSRRIEESLRNRIYEHLQTLSPAYFIKTKTGDLMARAINDMNAVRMATGLGLVALVDALVLGTTAIGFMLAINVKLTLISLIPAPVIVFFIRILTRRMSNGFESVQNTFSDLTERVREAFAGIRVVKAYNREDWLYKRVKEEGGYYVSRNLELAKTLALFFPMMALFTNTGLAIVIWLGGRLTILGEITTGDFVAFISYLNLLTWPMMAMGWVTNLIQRGSASMRRINRVLDEAPDIRDRPQVVAPLRVTGSIAFNGLTVRYPGQADDALKDVTLTIAAGETVAVVGRVGSGKSTLLSTLPRLLDPRPGTLFLDGRDVLTFPLSSLRRSIGFVTQDVFLFSDTIRNNVLFGLQDVSDDRLEAILRAADILGEIRGFDKGWDTVIGERGVTLSGGQRQRLTIARALLTDPPVLIMDDALSMVDTRTEERILNQTLELRQGKTNLIVSHRISTIGRADRVITLDSGRVVETGSHRALIAQGGVYAALYERQLIAEELEAGVP